MQNFIFNNNFSKLIFSVIFLSFFFSLHAKKDQSSFLGSEYLENMGKYRYKIEQLKAKRDNRKFFKEERPMVRKRLEELKELFNLLNEEDKKNERLDRIQSNDKRDKNFKEKKDSTKDQLQKISDQIKNFKGNGVVVGENLTDLCNRQKSLEEELENLERTLANLEVENVVLKDPAGERAKQFKGDLKQDINECEVELKYINTELLGGNIGDIIFRGIAGKNWDMIEDLKVGDNVLEGIGKGLMLRTSVSAGNAIGGIVDRYIQNLFDSTLGKVESLVSFIYRVIFHASCRPFTVEELNDWKNLISKDFRGIEDMIRNAEKMDSRGKADILREYEAEQAGSEQSLNLWVDFIEDLAFTYEELTQEIEFRKGYYSKEESGFGVVSCADHLIRKLLKIKSWLLSVKSLRDFSNIPEAKSIIPAMRRSIENYFDSLANLVRPSNDKKKTKINFDNDFGSPKNRWDNDFNDHSFFPASATD